MSLFGDAMQLEIEFVLNTANATGTEEQQPNLDLLGIQLELYGIFSFLPCPFFFHGKEISLWVRKRGQLIEKYEQEQYKY